VQVLSCEFEVTEELSRLGVAHPHDALLTGADDDILPIIHVV